MATQGSKRITYFDWLRGLATAAVVLLHEFNMVLSTHEIAELGTSLVLSWTWLQILLVRWAVPAFLMISGALLLDPARRIDWPKLGRYLLRLAGALALACPAYACVSARGITPVAIGRGLMAALTQSSWDHLWYVYALMGLYVLTPILRGYVKSASEHEQRLTLAVLAVVTLVLPTIRAASSIGLPAFAWVGSSFFYYLLGSYAHRYLRLTRPLLVGGIASLVVTWALSAWLVVGWQWYPLWLIKPACPLVALWSLCIVMAAKSLLDGRVPPAPVSWLSRHSMGIYLVHPIMFVVLYRRLFWLPYHPLPPVVFELTAYAMALGVSAAIVAVLSRLPGFRAIV